MLNESSILVSDKSSPPVEEKTTATQLPRDSDMETIETAVNVVMDVYLVDYDPPSPVHVRYTGQLRIDSETAYAQLDEVFEPLDYHSVLTTNEEGQHVIMALQGRYRPKPRPVWPNAVLFVLTLLSLLAVGAMHATETLTAELWLGIPYAVSMILILGSHELGHYFAARRHKVDVTLPYFIPLPLPPFGTMGAFIQLREPMRNKKTLFDVGIAGPIAGLVVAIPILLIGLATSNVEPLANEGIFEGDSLLYMTSKYVIFGEQLPNGEKDVYLNQLAMAGWAGLFITGLNLIPLGQLDGGHVMFTLFGRHAQRLYLPLLAGFFVLSFYNSMWLLWTVLLFVLGRFYAVPLDTVTELDSRRRWLGYFALLIFVLIFVPNPLRPV